MTLTLSTTEAQLRSLQKTVNESRKGAESIRLDREAVRLLLQDHHLMYGALTKRGQAPSTPEA